MNTEAETEEEARFGLLVTFDWIPDDAGPDEPLRALIEDAVRNAGWRRADVRIEAGGFVVALDSMSEVAAVRTWLNAVLLGPFPGRAE